MTLIGITVSNLDGEQAGVQLELPLEPRAGGLVGPLDELRERFGAGVVQRAAVLRRGETLTPWLFPGEAE